MQLHASPARALDSPASLRDEQSKVEAQKKERTVTAAAPVAREADANEKAGKDKSEEKPAANEPPPAPQVGSATVETRRGVIQTEQRPQPTATVELAKQQEAQPSRNEVREGGTATASAPAKTKAAEPAAAARARSISNFRIDGLASSAEMRVVAGRRFRKDESVWIDTAYAAPRATVNVTRGSEQYRALIADEPGIKTIADELDGEDHRRLEGSRLPHPVVLCDCL